MAVSVGELLAYLRLDSAQFDASVRAAQTEMGAAAGAATRMEGAVGASGAALTGAGRAAAAGARGTATYRAAQLSAVAATERYNAVLAQGDASLARRAAAEAAVIRANQRMIATNPAAAIRETNVAAAATPGLMARSASGFASAGKAALGLAAVFGAFELARKAIDVTKQANEFQRAMVQVQTNADVTATEVNKASGALLAMAGPVAAAPAELALAWYHAKSVGLDYAKSIETTRIATEGARVGNANLEETMNALTSTVASGIPGVKDMSSAMGQLIAIVGSGDMKLSDLNAALGSGILTVVKGYGLSLTDVGAALATFGDNNIRGAQAATMLRMAVQAMAVPAKAGSALIGELGLTSEGSAKALEKVHLTTSTLAKDMQSGGLNKAILDLKKHLDDAGVTGVQVGQVLTEMFGKRAGPGIAVLIGQTDRLESKFKILRDSGASFGDKWQATTQTASFALASLGHRLEAVGITLTQKLGPGIASAATWLGQTIPHAISVLRDILGPTIHLVGVGLGGAFQVLGVILGAAAVALSTVGHVLQANKGLVTGFTVTVLAMWAAFKGIAIAKAALTALNLALGRAAVAAEGAGAGIASMGAGSGAILALSAGLGILAIGWQQNQQLAAANKAAIDAFTNALELDNGAIGDNTRKTVENQLVKQNAYQMALKYGISQETLTNAALGQADAINAVNEALRNNGTPASGFLDAANLQFVAVAGTNGQLKIAIQGQKDIAAANGKSTDAIGKNVAATQKQAMSTQWSIDAHGRLVESSVKAGSALDNTTGAMARQTTASNILKNAIDVLNGVNLSVEQTTDQLNISLGQLANKTSLATNAAGKQSTSLDQSTIAGAQNREMLVGLIQNAKDAAQAVADHARAQGYTLAGALNGGNQALKKNEDAIRAAAKAAGLNMDAVNALIASIGKLAAMKPLPPKPKIDPKPAQTQIQKLQAQINAIKQGKEPGLNVDIEAAYQRIKYLQQLINSLRGITIGINAVNVGPGSSTYRSQVPHAPQLPGLIGAGGPNPYVRSSTSQSITVNQVINNPVPEVASTSGPANIRRAAMALGRAI